MIPKFRLLKSLFLILCLSPLYAQTLTGQENVTELVNAKNYDRAIELCQQQISVIKNKRNLANLYSVLGSIYDTTRKYDLAIDCLNKSVKLDKRQWKYWLSLGRLYYVVGLFEESKECLDKVIKIYKLSDEANFLLAKMLTQEQLYEKAIPFFENAAGLKINSTYYAELGNAFSEIGNYYQSAMYWNKAISTDPKIEYYYKLNDLHYRFGEYDKSIDVLTQLIQTNKNNAEYDLYLRRSIVYFKKSYYDKALDDINKVIQLNPKSSLAYLLRGLINYIQRDYNSALKTTRKTIELSESQFIKSYAEILLIRLSGK